MIGNNVFKFVSVRSPVLDTGKDRHFVANDAEQAAINSLRKELGKTHDLDRARLTLGAAMMDVPEYYSKNADWQSLRLFTSRVAALLQDTADVPNLTDFEQRADSLFSAAFGDGSIKDFLAGQRYHDLVNALWPSYYATVLNPHLRPQDREEMVIWIQFFALLSLLDDEPAFDDAAKKAPSYRPAVPIDFYRMTEGGRQPAAPEPPRVGVDPNRDNIGLSAFTYKQLDKFLWLQGDLLLKKKAEQPVVAPRHQ